MIRIAHEDRQMLSASEVPLIPFSAYAYAPDISVKRNDAILMQILLYGSLSCHTLCRAFASFERAARFDEFLTKG